eukprot:sb/3467708/
MDELMGVFKGGFNNAVQLFRGDIVKTATRDGTCSWLKTLVLISVRMGGDELNPAYQEPIQSYLSSSICLGIIGGRKRHSLYFTGFQGSKLIHYDPHRCQPVIKTEGDFRYESYVCSTPRKMAFSKMDPSCTFAFYLSSEDDLRELTKLSSRPGVIKVFEILDGTKEEYMTTIFNPTILAFDHNESMVDEGAMDGFGSEDLFNVLDEKPASTTPRITGKVVSLEPKKGLTVTPEVLGELLVGYIVVESRKTRIQLVVMRIWTQPTLKRDQLIREDGMRIRKKPQPQNH